MMENTQDLRRQVPRSRKIRPRRVQAKGLDLITLRGVCPRSEDKNSNQSTSVRLQSASQRHVPYYVSSALSTDPDTSVRND